MNTAMRNGLLLALTLIVLAGFGCGKKPIDDLTPGGLMEDEQPMSAEERQAAMNISSGIIYFDYDSFSLSGESKSILTQKAAVMKRYPQLRVIIEGHCDERGTEEYNLALGERRARAAYDFLINLGAMASQMEMVSFGKLHPAVSGSSEAAWAKNRRDEFKVFKPK